MKNGIGMVTLYDKEGQILGQEKMMCDVNGCKVVE